MKTVYYVGLDVHKDTIQMAVLGSQGKELVTAKGLANDPIKVVKALAPYQEKGSVQVAYEAGCMGYTLYRTLTEFGFDCRVLSPNKIFHGGGTKEQVKTDPRDALDIAWMLRRDEGDSIAIPSPEDEATRDLIRCRSDLQDDLKRTKQRLQKFLLRHGYTYDTDSYWTKRYYIWLKGLKFDRPLEKETRTFGPIDQYLSHITDLEDRIKRIDATIQEVAESEVYAERVQRFRAFKGVDYLIALSLVCEIGDFKRFSTAQAFMSYLGLVPRENSSGKKRQQGRITKAGNGHLRKLLTEAAWQYARPPVVGKPLAKRRLGTDEYTIGYADKAIKRLHGKYVKLLFKGKSKQTAITAVARELSGFLWGVMNRTAGPLVG
jgi:transposase